MLFWDASAYAKNIAHRRSGRSDHFAQEIHSHNGSVLGYKKQTMANSEHVQSRNPSQAYAYTIRISAEQDEVYLTTIVTAYFNLHSTAKHSSGAYSEWVASFYKNINNAMVIFTDGHTIHEIEGLRAGKPTIFYVYDNLWALPKLAAASETYKTEQHAKDPESAMHVPDLYFIWNSKLFMVNETATQNLFHSRYFAWVDSGAFRRPHNLKMWPDERQVTTLFQGNEGRIMLGLMYEPPLENVKTWSESMGPYMSDSIQGGFFVGEKKTIRWYADEFYRIHDVDAQNGYFVGKDQNLMNQIALMHPEKFFLLDTRAIKDACGDPWFYFEQALANVHERNDGCTEVQPVLLRWD